MKTIPRDVAQRMITKLDLGRCKVADVKALAVASYGVTLTGRTRAQVAKSICEHLKVDA